MEPRKIKPKYIKVSSNDNYYVHPYLVAEKYLKVASDRLHNDRGLLGPNYKALLERQILECHIEIEKKAK